MLGDAGLSLFFGWDWSDEVVCRVFMGWVVLFCCIGRFLKVS